MNYNEELAAEARVWHGDDHNMLRDLTTDKGVYLTV